MDGIEMIENIAKDIRNREDKDMAMSFTNVIGTLLVANGVTVETSKHELRNDFQQDKYKYMIEKEYGITIDGLDFTEHDKEVSNKLLNKDSPQNAIIDEFRLKIENLKLDLNKAQETNGVVLPEEPLDVVKILATETMHYTNKFTGLETECRKYGIKDLEQIAEHLLVYCKHNKEEE